MGGGGGRGEWEVRGGGRGRLRRVQLRLGFPRANVHNSGQLAMQGQFSE